MGDGDVMMKRMMVMIIIIIVMILSFLNSHLFKQIKHHKAWSCYLVSKDKGILIAHIQYLFGFFWNTNRNWYIFICSEIHVHFLYIWNANAPIPYKHHKLDADIWHPRIKASSSPIFHIWLPSTPWFQSRSAPVFANLCIWYIWHLNGV